MELHTTFCHSELGKKAVSTPTLYSLMRLFRIRTASPPHRSGRRFVRGPQSSCATSLWPRIFAQSSTKASCFTLLSLASTIHSFVMGSINSQMRLHLGEGFIPPSRSASTRLLCPRAAARCKWFPLPPRCLMYRFSSSPIYLKLLRPGRITRMPSTGSSIHGFSHAYSTRLVMKLCPIWLTCVCHILLPVYESRYSRALVDPDFAAA
mmetsp:Transcript_187/g.343  ORF Transcript_187/g.343 Transcript_187/m.343 type:complete len:207 (+) Transcript_187:469-1089(+)